MRNGNGYHAEDLGNVISLEHINVTVPDQGVATMFYVVGLGFTRDPHMNVGVSNMWANLGQQQFHLPTRPPQVIPGHIGLVMRDLQALQGRLKGVEADLKGTCFSWSKERDHVAVTCPWGNQFRCYAPGARFGDMTLGIPYVEFLVPPGRAKGIAQFYQAAMGTGAAVRKNGRGAVARVDVGHNQTLLFQETAEEQPPYDGHHIAVYVANFSRPYGFFEERGLIMEGLRNHQFRFKEFVQPKTGEHLFTLEHEVRSLRHPMFHRELVNRNPQLTMANFGRR